MYTHIKGGACFRCEGSGAEPTKAELARQKKARELSEARKAVAVATQDLDYHTGTLEAEARGIERRADRMVARGKAADHAEAMAVIKAKAGSQFDYLQQVEATIAIVRERLEKATQKLTRLEAAKGQR